MGYGVPEWFGPKGSIGCSSVASGKRVAGSIPKSTKPASGTANDTQSVAT